ncbi:MAG: nucleoside deaminase [Spirochaetia bacterium]|nr:nucleoside deaminase [Spirochaetia bacterium]
MNNPEDIPEYVKKAMQAAYDEAVIAYENNEVPIGAVIVKNKTILAADHNRIVERRDPTAHAELLVIQKVSAIIQNERLVDCELFTTLEPCAMCSGAIIMARIPVVYFLAMDEKLPGLRSISSLTGHNHTPSVICCENVDFPAGELLKKFFKNKRNLATVKKPHQM